MPHETQNPEAGPMPRIAFIDHSHHEKTISTAFIPQLLTKYGHTVDFFWDEYWRGGPTIPWDAVSGYDAVIMFQSFCPIKSGYYRLLHPNVTYIPMLDQFGICNGPLTNLSRFWEPFQGSKVLNFSHSAHAMTIGFGIKSLLVKYYKAPLAKPTAPTNGLHGFFWLRREEQVSWRTIRSLIDNTHFDSFHIHLASDPGSIKPTPPTDHDRHRFKISTSTWFEKKTDYQHMLERANIFIAPRVEEGIGHSFLEAFSRGQCVVAADHGTMNEYILHGVNGYLFDRHDPKPLEFSRASELGMAGWKSAREGYQRWTAAQEKIVEFILTPSSEYYSDKYNHFVHLPNNYRNLPRLTLREILKDMRITRRTRKLWYPIVCLIRNLKNRLITLDKKR